MWVGNLLTDSTICDILSLNMEEPRTRIRKDINMSKYTYFGPNMFQNLREIPNTSPSERLKCILRTQINFWNSKKAKSVEYEQLEDGSIMMMVTFDKSYLFDKKFFYDLMEMEILGLTGFSVEGGSRTEKEFLISYRILERKDKGNE